MIVFDDNGRVILTEEIPEIRQFFVREITEVHEFEELFHLRYRAYRDSRLSSFCDATESEVDINVYDLTSRHLGLFTRESGAERLVGCCRGVTGRLSPWHESIRLASILHGVGLTNHTMPSYSYPCLVSLPQGAEIAKLLEQRASEGLQIVEASRLCVLPEIRSLEVTRFLVECMFAFFIPHLGLDIGVCYVARSQRRFYETFGFSRMPGFSDQYIAHAGLTFTPMCVTADNIAADKRPRIEQLARQFDLLGIASLDVSEDCLPAKRNQHPAAA
jgi:hypothetical protein